MNVSGLPAAGHNKFCYAAVSCLNAWPPSLNTASPFPRKTTDQAWQRKCTVVSAAREAAEQDTTSWCQLAGKKIQNLNARNSIKARQPPTSTSTIRISMQASCFCYFRCAPRLLTLILLSHSGAPSLNASMVRFRLRFGTWRHRIPSDSLLQVGFRDSAAPRNYFVVLCLISA